MRVHVLSLDDCITINIIIIRLIRRIVELTRSYVMVTKSCSRSRTCLLIRYFAITRIEFYYSLIRSWRVAGAERDLEGAGLGHLRLPL